METAAQRLRQALRQKRVSQQALAERVGVSQSAVKHWLAHQGPPARHHAAVEEALSLPRGYLLGHYDTPLSPEAQNLVRLLQEGRFTQEELHAFLKVCALLGQSLDLHLDAPAQRSAPAARQNLRLAEPPRPYRRSAPATDPTQESEAPAPRRRRKPRLSVVAPPAGPTVTLYRPGKAAASPAGRDWFDPLDHPPSHTVPLAQLRWLGVQQPLDPRRHYVLEVEGDSMAPLIAPGGLCVVAHSETLMPGLPHVVAWRTPDGDERVAVKHLKKHDHGLVLQSLNPAHPEITLLPHHQPHIRGHVVAVW